MLLVVSVVLAVSLALGSTQSPTGSTTQGSCQNFTSCCDPTVYPSCLGTPGDCYCDQICYEFNDCCGDISNGCLAASNEPTADTGSCVNQGFSGCCNPNLHVTCKGDDNICYCDQVCFQYGDCCSDIGQIGCYADASSPTVTATEGSCVAAGFESCCNPSDSANCYGNPPTCYCDQVCFEYNDCCSDVGQICTVESPTDTVQGSCAGLGFTSGCCVPSATQNCHGTDGICYCDEQCYNFGDCCSDIEEINCLNVQPTGAEGSCVAQGFEGCCNPSANQECYGSAGTSCYCDEVCFQFGDCCSDIAQIGCLEPSTQPTLNNGSCLLGGHLSCCSISAFEQCLGSDGTCHCDAACYNYGDCCKDIALLLCAKPTNTANGSCQAAGYNSCCHPYTNNVDSCYGNPQTCYCDQLCYQFGDCCDDVTSIGCLAPTGDVQPNTGSCAAKKYTSCCIPSDTQSCLGYPETCHCDAVCHEYGDCCADVIDIGCFAQTGSCIDSGRTSCCLSDDPDCTGMPANCFCDQGCFDRGDCCSDIGNLKNCHVEEGIVSTQVLSLKAIPLSDTSLNITWQPPGTPNGANLYIIRLKNYTKTPNEKVIVRSSSIYKTYYVFNDLKPLHPYNVTVVAVNEFGNGKWNGKTVFTKEGIPQVAPRNLKAIRTDASTLTVTWTPLNYSEAQGIVNGYQLVVSPMARRKRSSDSITKYVSGWKQRSVAISGLKYDKKYEVTIAAKTGAGVGVASKVTKEVAGGTSPSSSGQGSSSPINYGLIIGIVFGIFGLILVVLGVGFVVLLVFMKTRNKGSGSGPTASEGKYTRLLVNANDDDSDDEELID